MVEHCSETNTPVLIGKIDEVNGVSTGVVGVKLIRVSQAECHDESAACASGSPMSES